MYGGHGIAAEYNNMHINMYNNCICNSDYVKINLKGDLDLKQQHNKAKIPAQDYVLMILMLRTRNIKNQLFIILFHPSNPYWLHLKV